MLAVDRMIGGLQTAVAASGQAQNTYFVFSSDNGYHMGDHRPMPGKMNAFDTDIREPLVVTGPGVVHGRILDEVVENLDLVRPSQGSAVLLFRPPLMATRWCRSCGKNQPGPDAASR